jgi:YVTN family beta-propeller protein
VKILGVVLAAAAAAGSSGFHVVDKIQVGGGGGWDYLTMDSASKRLYASNATRVVVVNVDTKQVVGEIPDTAGVHGIALAPDLNRGFTSNGRANTVTVVDLATLKPLSQVKVGENPDAILYDAASARVFTFNGRSHDATVLDAKTGTVAGTIPLGGKPEFAVTDGKGKIFVNIEDTSELVVIDVAKQAVLRRSSLKPCEEPSGLAIDLDRRRLFSVCGNQLMVVSEADSGRVIGSAAIGSGTDGAGFDQSLGIAFSSNGEGTLTLVQEVSGKYEPVDTVVTERGARTMTVDPTTHRVYLPTAEFGPPPAPTAEQPRPRPAAVPGTFHIVVVGK